MSTTLVTSSGGADRVGLDNLLGTNNHPMNGLAYTQEVLGGSLMGVLPLKEGRYACFFREYSRVVNEEIVQEANKVLVVSTVSGNSRVISLGVENETWKSLDVSGNMAYLLTEDDGDPWIHTIQASVDRAFLLGSFVAPAGTTSGGTRFDFDTSLSVVGGSLYVSYVHPEEGLFFARKSRAQSHSWSYSSGGVFQANRGGLLPQDGQDGTFKVQGTPHLVDIHGSLHLFDHADNDVKVYKKNRYGAWEVHGEVVFPGESESVIGFCLVKEAPAYSVQGSRYTVPAVFSVSGEPITQHWVKADIN